jgi:hypothetical protein
LCRDLSSESGADKAEAQADDPPFVSVQFIGGLLKDNFAAVVTDLGHKGLLPNKVVLTTKRTPAEELFAENPEFTDALTSEQLVKYLCELNPHVCFPKAGIYFWTNQISTRTNSNNTVCGTDYSKKLSPDELCLPDLKLSSFPAGAEVDYNGEVEHLPRKVLSLGVCKSYNDDCVNSIITENPHIWPRSVRSGTYVGMIRLPIVGYELDLYPADAQQLNAIQDRLKQVIAARQNAGQFDNHNPNISSFVQGGPFKPLGVTATSAVAASAFGADIKGYMSAMNYPWIDPD